MARSFCYIFRGNQCIARTANRPRRLVKSGDRWGSSKRVTLAPHNVGNPMRPVPGQRRGA